MAKENIRNIAIIAHVDHGKTTLVDGLLQQSGTFSEHQVLEERVMDSGDLEKERGITITSKNTAIHYNNIKINIVDTPGHADFGGEVERSLNLVDGVLLLVDSSEGPLPQTRFVLKKALERNLPVILVINKIDRSDARIDEVVEEVYDLFIDLDANDKQIEFPIVYTNAKDGVAHESLGDESTDLIPLLNLITSFFSGPETDDTLIPQFLVTNLAYDSYVGQVAIGRLDNGILELNKQYSLCGKEETINNQKFSALYTFKGLEKVKVEALESGDIIAVAGIDNIQIGDTISSNDNPSPLPRIEIDEPTVSIFFHVNNGPFAGREGKYVTSRNINDRLQKEILSNVSLQIIPSDKTDVFEVRGRGELQMAVLIETMRREGYEVQIGQPRVIIKEIDGIKCEPIEELTIDVPEHHSGKVIEFVSLRKGNMLTMEPKGDVMHLEFEIPSRGIIGLRNTLLTTTQGEAIISHRFKEFQEHKGDIPQRINGSLISMENGNAIPYSLNNLQDRGKFFVTPNQEIYEGQVVGEHSRPGDVVVNLTKAKKQSNVRSSGADEKIKLIPPQIFTLEEALEYIQADEYVEVTPDNIRLRKIHLKEHERKRARNAALT